MFRWRIPKSKRFIQNQSTQNLGIDAAEAAAALKKTLKKPASFVPLDLVLKNPHPTVYVDVSKVSGQ
jgi:hypothetical protein